MIYLSSFLVCYLDISSKFLNAWDKLKNVNFHASWWHAAAYCLQFAANVMLNLYYASLWQVLPDKHCIVYRPYNKSLTLYTVFPIYKMWCYSNEDFIWNFIFCTYICRHKLWKEERKFPPSPHFFVLRQYRTRSITLATSSFEISPSPLAYVWESCKHWPPFRGLLHVLDY